VTAPKRHDDDVLSRPTIRDIAGRAGVSIATVSRVLNGRPDVAPATRQKVLRHIQEEGFTGSLAARALVGSRTGLIGLTVPYLTGEYFAEIIEGAAEALYERDARFVLGPTQHRHDREVSLLDRVMHGTTDGALLILPSESPAELERLLEQNFPFVVVDPMSELPWNIPVVAAAHWSGATAVMQHLVSLGHRRIAAITGPRTWPASNDRLAGYRTVLSSAGLPVCEDLIRESDFQIEGGYGAARELLSLSERPTAIFAFNDNMAAGVVRAAREHGLRVPTQLSIVGFDDVQLASVLSPMLTTVRQPLREMGRVAVSLLSRLLDDHRLEATRLELSTRLVVRESTAPPPGTD
jgi:LacI family transcriptional regulator